MPPCLLSVQEAVILHGSLRHNLDYLDLAGLRTDDQVMEALEAVGLVEVAAAVGGLDGDLQATVRRGPHPRLGCLTYHDTPIPYRNRHGTLSIQTNSD